MKQKIQKDITATFMNQRNKKKTRKRYILKEANKT